MNRVVVFANSCFILLGVGFLASCASNPKKNLLQQTGIVVCSSAIVKPLSSDHGDVFRFAVSAKSEGCIPSLPAAIINASKGGCRGLIDIRGSCSYAFGNRTVIAEKVPSSGDISRFEVRSW
jgi:hypothetical protein